MVVLLRSPPNVFRFIPIYRGKSLRSVKPSIIGQAIDPTSWVTQTRQPLNYDRLREKKTGGIAEYWAILFPMGRRLLSVYCPGLACGRAEFGNPDKCSEKGWDCIPFLHGCFCPRDRNGVCLGRECLGGSAVQWVGSGGWTLGDGFLGIEVSGAAAPRLCPRSRPVRSMIQRAQMVKTKLLKTKARCVFL